MRFEFTRKHNLPDFVDWLFDDSGYNIVWADPEDLEDSTIVITMPTKNSKFVDEIYFEVQQDGATLTFIVFDPKPSHYDYIWDRLLDSYKVWALANFSNLPSVVQVTFEYTPEPPESEDIEK